MTRLGAYVQSVRTAPSSASQRGVASSASPLGAEEETEAESWPAGAPSERQPLGTPRSEARSILATAATRDSETSTCCSRNANSIDATCACARERNGCRSNTQFCAWFRMSASISIVHLVHKDEEGGPTVRERRTRRHPLRTLPQPAPHPANARALSRRRTLARQCACTPALRRCGAPATHV